jgi:hypothetical protein
VASQPALQWVMMFSVAVGDDQVFPGQAVLADGGVLRHVFLGDGGGFGQAASQRASGASGRRCFSMRASAQCRLTAVGRVAPSTAMASASRSSEASKSSAMARP